MVDRANTTRRRQGKTFLLEAICQAAGGFYFGATEATDPESLRRISAALTEHVRPTTSFHFHHWAEVFDALLELGSERPIPVVNDEFPYLAKANPELPSIIEEALRPRRAQRHASRTRILLCGSALSFMGRILSGNAPLSGRDWNWSFIRSTTNWPHSSGSYRIHTWVGGTPAYRREFARGDTPHGPEDFDDWSFVRC
ncbi:AAA family ATPase [Nocardia aobensis]|uniref:AAA family ATPase n=1 Tax=Nocardia aobensis TaxID=257277 RepID=UPI0002D64BD7|nr:hypothetical protein [Nocardia aobensis]